MSSSGEAPTTPPSSSFHDIGQTHQYSQLHDSPQVDVDIGKTPPRQKRGNHHGSLDSNSQTEQLMSPSPIRTQQNSTWPSPFRLLELSSLPSIGEEPDEIRSKIRETNQLLIYNMTWNLHGKAADPAFTEYLPPRNSFHILAFGTEECENTIAKSVLNTSKENWERQLQSALGQDYIALASRTLQAIHLIVFVHRSLFPIISDVQTDVVSCGTGDTLGNKGSVAIGCNIGNTSLLFVNCHFAAHRDNIELRNRDYLRSETMMEMCPTDLPADQHSVFLSDRYDRVVWIGDMNYRINLSREEVDKHINEDNYEVLYKYDQLTQERMKGRTFQGFAEGPLHFYPTYKFDKGKDTYDSSGKGRVPSWTDRILFKPASRVMRLFAYDSIHEVKCSDHRAVYAAFRVQLRKHFRREDELEEIQNKLLPRASEPTQFDVSPIEAPALQDGLTTNLVDVPWTPIDTRHEWFFHEPEREHRDKQVPTNNVPIGHTQSQVCGIM
eukprot:gb/GECG01015378.1/.p1 GENE.gb/GECG01015378.1/~~gb/GECG01015378.1/.p1  ORF type:complete len:495 (+),score=39.34 gb/GECG01015378.1/:1-1485(+)